MKTVGKRKAAKGLEAAREFLRTVLRLRRDQPFMPKGVYRFKTFEEAQEWALKMMTRKRKAGL